MLVLTRKIDQKLILINPYQNPGDGKLGAITLGIKDIRGSKVRLEVEADGYCVFRSEVLEKECPNLYGMIVEGERVSFEGVEAELEEAKRGLEAKR